MMVALAFVVCTITAGAADEETCSPMASDPHRYSSYDDCLVAAREKLPKVISEMNEVFHHEGSPYRAGGVFCTEDVKGGSGEFDE